MEDQIVYEELTLETQLAQLRDEIALKIHLGKAELQTLWEDLERKWTLLQSRLAPLRIARKEAAAEIQEGVKGLMGEIEEGYKTLRAAFHKD